MDALEGAKKIISTQHPKLAISVYHKLDDMWKIPQTNMSSVQQCKVRRNCLIREVIWGQIIMDRK